MIKIARLDKSNERLWEDYVAAHPAANAAHTLDFKEVFASAYGFKPIYLLALDEGKAHGVLPCFLTDSFIFGRKLTSAPFNFFNGPLFDTPEAAHALLSEIISEGRDNDADYVELKCGNALACADSTFMGGWREFFNYRQSRLSLEPSYDLVSRKSYHRNLRRNLSKWRNGAERKGCRVRELRDLADLKSFYDLMVLVRRDKFRMIPPPWILLKETYAHFSRRKEIKIWLMTDNADRLIGGMLLLMFQKTATAVWSATDPDYQHLSPFYLLIDSAIQFCAKNGFRYFDLGITSPHHKGLLDFKERWGCQTKNASIYFYLIGAKKYPNLDYHTAFPRLRGCLAHVPLGLLKMMSPLVTRHLA